MHDGPHTRRMAGQNGNGRAVRTRLGPALLLSVLAFGCNGRGIEPRPPSDAREAVQRINNNLAKIEGALFCKALASFRFRDASGGDRRFIGQEATVIFEAPRCLYFDIKHALTGSVARIGGNAGSDSHDGCRHGYG